MAREKGTGSLQREKSGRWTMRVCIAGTRYSRSTRTKDRTKAEEFLNRFLAPFGLGERMLPLADVWREYEKSPNRRELAASTIDSKRTVWMRFADWMEVNHVEISQLSQLTVDAVSEYLRVFRLHHSASTYNKHVCVLREICHVLADKGGIVDDPWANVRLLPDDSHTRREFSVEELKRLMEAAARAGEEWHTLFLLGMYTGLRLGDCCRLQWSNVNLARKVIQVIPSKTRKFAKGRPITIPIHDKLIGRLNDYSIDSKLGADSGADERQTHCHVLPQIADWYVNSHWRISHTLQRIFIDAGITTSVKIDGRRTATPDATFHSLRHTFVSFSANAGVPLPVVSSIVGHSSTAMTRHYYHENEAALRRAVEAVPDLDAIGREDNPQPPTFGTEAAVEVSEAKTISPAQRLKRLERYLVKGVITHDEYAVARQRIIDAL